MTTPKSLEERGIQELIVYSRETTRPSVQYSNFIENLTHEASYQGLSIVEKDTFPTTEGFVESLQEIQRSGADSEQAYALYGGDGTTNRFLTAVRKVGGRAILFAGGNKNDVSSQANTAITKRYPELLLKKNVLRLLHPLEANIQTSEGDVDITACGYLGFGITARIAHLINQPDYKQNRLYDNAVGRHILEHAAATRGIMRSPRFMTTTKNEMPRRAAEILFSNGALLAGKFKLSAELFTRRARVVEAAHSVEALGIATALRFGVPIGHDLGDDMEFKLTGQKGVWVQYDGESLFISSPATVRVGLSEKPVKILSAPFAR